jgi:acetyltransferase-like isoleucine patch superfamily enzyme
VGGTSPSDRASSCAIPAKGTTNQGIRLGSGVFLGRGTILSCKDGDIELGDHVNIGFHSEVFSGSRVTVGKYGLFAAYTYLVGGGHEFDRPDVPVIEQERSSRGITLGDNVWLGTGAKVLDGVRVGRDVVVGAGAVVTEDLPDGVVAVGVPARAVRRRESHEPAATS